jgi:hypothetical protein
MPRAAPNSRVVSFMAEPTPALSSGTADMSRPVDGAAAPASPSPTRAAVCIAGERECEIGWPSTASLGT